MAKPIAVLAYSGGLDTSVLLHWLQDNGWDVAAYTANLGQPGADLDSASEKARQLGAVDTYIEDLRGELVDEFFLPVLQMHARYEGRYLLGTAIARIPTARGQMRYAKRIGGNVLVHGSTGKGNDQVRFETIYRVLQEDPQFTLQGFDIYAPWKEPDFLARFGDGGRRVMTAYSHEHGIPLPTGGTDEGPPYSQDANILHISSEGRALEKPEDDHRQVMFTYLSRWESDARRAAARTGPLPPRQAGRRRIAGRGPRRVGTGRRREAGRVDPARRRVPQPDRRQAWRGTARYGRVALRGVEVARRLRNRRRTRSCWRRTRTWSRWCTTTAC